MTHALHDPAVRELHRSIRTHLVAAALGLTLLFVGLGGWAAVAAISAAVVAEGQIVVDSSAKKIQHPTGGVVKSVHVRDGDVVKAGDVLVQLDEAAPRANLAILSKQLIEARAKLARLSAEREGASEADIALAFVGDPQDEALAAIVRSEQRVLILRRSAREVQKRQLSERAKQFEDEIAGLSRQVSAKVAENHLVQKELAGVDDLYEKKLVTLQRLSQLQREAVRIEGERGQLEAAIAEARGKIIETELKILQIDEDLRSEVARDSREAEGRIADLSERRQVAEEQLRYATLRAPQDGIVHQSIIHSAGEVVPPNTVIMLIVPDSDLLTVEAKVLPRDIDRLRVGQHARLRLTSFEARTTPELDGRVERISPDQNTDPRTGQGYFTARIAIVPGPGRNELRLLPGMTAEVFVETGLRPVLSYLTKPIEDQLHHAFRER